MFEARAFVLDVGECAFRLRLDARRVSASAVDVGDAFGDGILRLAGGVLSVRGGVLALAEGALGVGEGGEECLAAFDVRLARAEGGLARVEVRARGGETSGVVVERGAGLGGVARVALEALGVLRALARSLAAKILELHARGDDVARGVGVDGDGGTTTTTRCRRRRRRHRRESAQRRGVRVDERVVHVARDTTGRRAGGSARSRRGGVARELRQAVPLRERGGRWG